MQALALFEGIRISAEQRLNRSTGAVLTSFAKVSLDGLRELALESLPLGAGDLETFGHTSFAPLSASVEHQGDGFRPPRHFSAFPSTSVPLR